MASAMLGVAGCQKALNEQKTLTMGPGDVRKIEIDAPRREQPLKIAFNSSATEVSIYVVPAQDGDKALDALMSYKPVATALAKMEKTKSGTLDATIPAKTAFAVLVAGAVRDTTVDLKITSN
jgi:hypothetical protein